MREYKVHEIEELVEVHGEDFTLGQLLEYYKGDKIYKCPKCEGKGVLLVEFKPSYMGFIPPINWTPSMKEIDCDLCNGEGYTSEEYEAVNGVVDYRKKNEEDSSSEEQ